MELIKKKPFFCPCYGGEEATFGAGVAAQPTKHP